MSDLLQVNALAMKRNREQTKRICELKGWGCNPNASALSPRPYAYKIAGWDKMTPPEEVELPNGSFTLDQVVGMLEVEQVNWHHADEVDPNHDDGTVFPECGWYKDWEEWPLDALVIVVDYSFDLTAALDALIKVLEEKK